jgi:hypothetical protein
MRGEQDREAEGLRGLRPIQAFARHGGGDVTVGDAFQRVRDGRGRDRASRVFQRRQEGRDRAGRDQRSRCVMHKDDVRCVRRQRLQARADAVLARGAAGHHRQM